MPHILIIEDEMELLRPMTLLLEAKGFLISSCLRGDLAIAAVEQNKPDLILLDLILPYLSGVEVCQKIRSTSEVPIIVITGNNSPHLVLQLFSLGVDDFVAKPFNIKELLLRINSVMKRCAIF